MLLGDLGIAEAEPQLARLLVERGLADQLREDLAVEAAARAPDRA